MWFSQLSDAEIAALLTHIRPSWGNKAQAITDASIKAERSTTRGDGPDLAERPQ